MPRDFQLQSFVDEYQLEFGGVRFWTPYWINRNVGEFHLDAPYCGKGTPAQLLAALKRAHDGDARSPEEYRRAMRTAGLGVDCSGFVYHVVSRALAAAQLPSIAEQIMITRAEVEETLKHRPERPMPTFTNGVVSLAELTKLWHKDTEHYVNAARLASPALTVPIARMIDVRPGDLIKSSINGDHIAVVTSRTETTIAYAQPIYRIESLGGVEQQTITLVDPTQGLEAQDFADKRIFGAGANGGVYRLRTLDFPA